LEYQKSELFGRQAEHKIPRKPVAISAHCFVEVGGADSIQNREICAEHDARFADKLNPVRNHRACDNGAASGDTHSSKYILDKRCVN
jgi:hypothetical protein